MFYQVSGSGRDHRCFPGTGTGQNHHRSFPVKDRLFLFLIQIHALNFSIA